MVLMKSRCSWRDVEHQLIFPLDMHYITCLSQKQHWLALGCALYVRPGAAGLLIDIECSRVRDSSWMYLTSFVTTRIGIELAAVQRKLPDCVVVGLQLYSARTFHVTYKPYC